MFCVSSDCSECYFITSNPRMLEIIDIFSKRIFRVITYIREDRSQPPVLYGSVGYFMLKVEDYVLVQFH